VTPTLYPFEPQSSVSAGAYLAIVLQKLDMTQSDLAARTGLSTKHINQVVKHGAAISPSTAAELEFATGVRAELWAALDARHQARLARESTEEKLGNSLDWLSQFDLSELKDRGIVRSASCAAATAAELLRYFAISDPGGWTRVWQPSLTSFRRSPSFKPDAVATTLWLRAGQRQAASLTTERFDERALRAALPRLRELTIEDPADALPKLRDELGKLGVAVAYVAEFAGCRASGATWWATPTKAVILLSNRGKREDRFWFSVFHELGHVLLHAKRETFLDQNRVGDESDELPPWEDPPPTSGFIDDGSRDSELERQADEFAADTLIPPSQRTLVRAATSDLDILRLAESIPVSPGIVAGRHQFETSNYTKFNKLRRVVPDDLFRQPV
jgi:HTH-type transcriptional regulator/antitoxin HigA